MEIVKFDDTGMSHGIDCVIDSCTTEQKVLMLCMRDVMRDAMAGQRRWFRIACGLGITLALVGVAFVVSIYF